MTHSERILEELCTELGFSPDLVGGRKVVLAKIERFCAVEGMPDDLDPLSQPELWSRLVSEIVVPETSFFRYPESFAMLRDWAPRQSARSLQILCLPCSTGEEAYSISMTLLEAGLTDFRIIACDASAPAIRHAHEGRYLVQSTRGLSEPTRARWFGQRDRHLFVDEAVRQPIIFRTANVFSFDASPKSFDIIFCRNLLIYFSAANQVRIFERLDSWLRPEGILFLGPGEATTASSHGWQNTDHPMSFSFTRRQKRPPSPRQIPPPVARRALLPKPVPKLAPPTQPPRNSPSTPEMDWLSRARELADSGKHDVAADALMRFHASHDATSESMLLRGILDEARGNRASAEADYRKALYLDPNQLEALLHLSLLLESEGRTQAAIPFRQRAKRLTSTS